MEPIIRSLPEAEKVLRGIARLKYAEYDLADPFICSNDANVSKVIPEMQVEAVKWESGCSLLVGAGGLLSLMPELKSLDLILVVDKDDRVLHFQHALIEAIVVSDDPQEVIEKMVYGFQRALRRSIRDMIHEEGYQYGGYHWTDPSRFVLVKQLIGNKSVRFIHQDILSSSFTHSLRQLIDLGFPLRFANLTNVQAYVDSATSLRRLPIQDETLLLFSSHEESSTFRFPQAKLVRGSEEYFRSIIRDNEGTNL
ncbi:MAG: hypothetical protein ACMG6E_00605 [Candidatus Roizmanbacteria bacterium]